MQILVQFCLPVLFLLSIVGIIVGVVRKQMGKPDGQLIVWASLAVPFLIGIFWSVLEPLLVAR